MEELEIRSGLKAYVERMKAAKKGRLVEELGVCQGIGRIDLALINGHFIGYEIKSEKDTLKRLESQIPTYQKIFDKLTLVTAEKHLEQAVSSIPATWGVIVATKPYKTVRLKTIRRATYNKDLDPYAIVQLLWKDEAVSLLKELGLESGISKMHRDQLWEHIVELLPLHPLKAHVSAAIIKRQFWRSDLRQT